MPMWLICSCWRACCQNTSGTTITLPFMMTQSVTAMSSLNVQYGLMFCCTWSLCSGQPYMIYSLRHCMCWSWQVTCCSSWIVIHSGLLVVVCIALIPNCIPGISASLSLLWFIWIASLLWIGLVQACIRFSLCIDVFWISWSLCDNVCSIFFEYCN